MARSHYKYEKRRKELARQKKKEEKRQRKLEKKIIESDENPLEPSTEEDQEG